MIRLIQILALVCQLTLPLSASCSFSHFIFLSNLEFPSPGVSPYSESETWNSSASGIIRPSSTPGQLSSSAVRYEDSLRHASFSGAPMSQAQMFAGSGRISGQHDRKHVSSIKGEWSFPNQDFVLSSGNPQYSPSLGTNPPAISVAPPASRSPPSAMPSSSLVDRPQRKRGKLPKETTDYLKAWLHRHSDHPYPSEEEKKQLCHATGLSMSQVSNWMINVSSVLFFFEPLIYVPRPDVEFWLLLIEPLQGQLQPLLSLRLGEVLHYQACSTL